jgi:excisionase family DNA binding protein
MATATVRREAVSVEEAARILGVSRRSAYRHAKTGALPTVRIGGRIVVPIHRLAALLDGEARCDLAMDGHPTSPRDGDGAPGQSAPPQGHTTSPAEIVPTAVPNVTAARARRRPLRLKELRPAVLECLSASRWLTPTDCADILGVGHGNDWLRVSLLLERLAHDGYAEIQVSGIRRRFRRAA